jgi:hypothetical protein
MVVGSTLSFRTIQVSPKDLLPAWATVGLAADRPMGRRGWWSVPVVARGGISPRRPRSLASGCF